MRNRRFSTIATVAGVLIVAALLAGVVFVAWRNRVEPLPPAMTAEQARELIHAKNVGLGLLENQRLDEARQSFEKVAAGAPDDPLATRNMAVARVLALGVDFEEAEEPAVAAAREAIEAVRALEGENLPYRWLALRVAMAQRDFAAAEAHVNAILEQQPDDPAGWYARYRVRRVADAEADADAGQTLWNAYERSSGNAWLLVEWLRVAARQIHGDLAALPRDEAQREAALAEVAARHGTLAEKLQTARPTVQAFSYVIQVHANIDAVAFLDQAIAGAEQNDFQTAAGRMLVLANVLLPHSAADQQPVNKHPLEFILERFEPAFYEAAQVSEVEPPPAIEVAFAANPTWQLPSELQEGLGEVLDFSLADFDLDGRLDVIALSAEQVAVWSRDESGAWRTIASAAVEGMNRLVVQDLDADFDETRQAAPAVNNPDAQPIDAARLKEICPTADVDMVLYGAAGIRLLENRYDATSRERSLVPPMADSMPGELTDVLAVVCAELDADGDLDLAIAAANGLHLWANLGEWSFADISNRSVLPEGLADAAEILALDWDRDVDIDVLVAAPSGGGWLENVRHGQFRWREFDADFQPLAGAAALEAVEADGNASWDVVAGGQSGVALVTTQTPSSGVIRAASDARLSDFAATHVIAWDYDNDGADDLLAWSAESIVLLRGLGDRRFEPADLLQGVPTPIEHAAVGDVDGDGDLDLALLSGGRVHCLENQGGDRNHWLVVALQAQQIKGQQITPSGRVSPYGVGCLLELKAGTRYQARFVRGQTTHFGLGRETEADVVRVSWLNGVPQNIIQPAADLFVCEQQVLNTSCPYLYAWNGERFVFVTDLLWNAPLGLQVAEGQLAPWREWEYLKIPGEMVAEKDGHYVLQVTAEMWEAEYFDEVKLIAVDHPADVAIYSNEKVGPPSMAEFKIHTVRQPRPLVGARNHAGRDLLPELMHEDGVYARTFERKMRQGVVEDHYVELDLGNLEGAKRVTLLLTGWFYPAATSINVALSQGGGVAPARPPSLEVPDGQGGWTELLPFMGFPGGKTKTIAVELAAEALVAANGSASQASARCRIRTSMELYWDHIFFAVDEPPAGVRVAELDLVSADLHWRGFSRVVPDPHYGPEQFLYDDVSTAPKWPPIQGKFTRLGDVKELLIASDDKLLVMMAGDETTVRFAVPKEPVPPGWKRDFLMYNVGWDKDANLQTVAGKTVEPLPFRAMSAYPWPPDEKTPDSPEYKQYVREYQTRDEGGWYWKSVLRFPRE